METTPTAAVSIHERLKMATAYKDPGSINIPTLKAPEPAKVVQKMSAPAWNSDDDFESDKPASDKTVTEGAVKTAEGSAEPKLSVKDMKLGARSIANMYNVTQRMIFSKLENNKFKSRFTKDQILALEQIEGKKTEDLEETERRLKSFWAKHEKRHEKILDGIPFTDAELKDIEDCAYFYQEESGKPIPKWLYGLFTVLHTSGKRVADIYTD